MGTHDPELVEAKAVGGSWHQEPVEGAVSCYSLSLSCCWKKQTLNRDRIDIGRTLETFAYRYASLND